MSVDTEGTETEVLDTEIPDLSDEGEAEETETETETETEAEGEDEGESEGEGRAQGGQETDEGMSRRTRRVQALERERDAERERAAKLEKRLEDAIAAIGNNRHQAQPDPSVARQEREARLALMEPHEKENFLRDERLQALEAQVRNTGFQTADSEDRIRFSVKAEVNPVYAKYSDQVEKKAKELRAQGIVVQREAVLKFLIGEQALRKMTEAKGTPKPKVKETSRVTTARGTPPSARSDVSGSKGGKSLREKLENVPL